MFVARSQSAPLTRRFSSVAWGLSQGLLCGLLCGAALAACAGKEPDGVTGVVDNVDAGQADAGDTTPVVPVCPPENEFCQPHVVEAGVVTCGTEQIDLTPSGVNVMIAVDGSYAMRGHWTVVQDAIKKMLEANSDLNFGAHLFWANASDLPMVFNKLNFCGSTVDRVLDVKADQHQDVLSWLGPKPPGPGGQWFSLRPVVDPLRYYLDHQTELSNPKTTNYLVFISNGSDNCFGTAFAAQQDKFIAYEKLAIELLKKNIRVLPIGFDGETAQRTWNGKLRTNFEALDRLSKFGGTGIEKALAADSSEELEQALNKVTEMVRGCRFKIPDALDPSKNLNPFQLTFLVNGKEVPRDRTHKGGWDFVAGNTSEVETYGDVCVAMKAGNPLEARKGCNSNTCGTAAAKIQAKGRAVEYLLDRSLSMAECEKPGLLGVIGEECILDYGNTLSWWGKATRSIAQSLTSTINDDVEFGLQYFPSPEGGGCEISDKPDVEITQSSEITVIGSLLANLPLGSTPLVAGLEKVAASPGRLGDPGMTSAVIILSDGGNACDNISPADAVTRLGAAAKSLSDRGIKVYAVRFGPKDTAALADQDAQLRAIVTNGGTAVVDPADPSKPPYLDAPDQAQLDTILTGVSEQLSSCDFEVGSGDKNADKDKVNLYIDGQAIPFDSMSKLEDGWGWADDTRTVIRMYGPACKNFKNSRATSIVVEFGCATIPLL
jgi:hypothetical protein